MAQLYLKKRSDGLPNAVEGTDSGALYVNVDAQTPPTTLPLPTGAATEATIADVKTAVEALAVATPDTTAGDLASMSADLGTVKADIALMKADLAAILAILES